jgi:hypothetical protein
MVSQFFCRHVILHNLIYRILLRSPIYMFVHELAWGWGWVRGWYKNVRQASRNALAGGGVA